MPRLPNVNGRDARKAFERAGWRFTRQHGSHMILSKDGHRANLSIPDHAELAPGTLRSLLRAAELTVEEFMDLLRK